MKFKSEIEIFKTANSKLTNENTKLNEKLNHLDKKINVLKHESELLKKDLDKNLLSLESEKAKNVIIKQISLP